MSTAVWVVKCRKFYFCLAFDDAVHISNVRLQAGEFKCLGAALAVVAMLVEKHPAMDWRAVRECAQ